MNNSERDTPLNLAGYWALVCHRRWWLLAVFVAGWALVLGGSWVLPAEYRSETVILVEGQKVPKSIVESNVASDLQQRLQNITQQIMSRTRLSQIASQYHLYEKKGKNNDPDALVERMRKDIQIELVKAGENELTAFKVTYSAPSPQLAQQITGALTVDYIEDNLRSRKKSSIETTEFLDNEVQVARADLAQQEQRLREFKGKYLGELPEQLQSNVQILSGLQSRMQAATEALNQAEQQRLYLDSLLGQYRGAAMVEGSANPSLPALDQELEKLKSQLSDLNGRYTPQHPDIVRLKEQIAATEKLKESMEREARSGKKPDASAAASVSSRANSPTMQIEAQIRANQLNITNRRSEIKDLEAQIRQYEARLNLTPVREQELAAVTRDYQQSRANYDNLLAKKQKSETATNMEERQEGEQFRVLDPPSLPLKPYFPDHFKMSLLGIAVGLGLTLGMVIVFEFADAKVYAEDDLRDLTTVPVFVGIPSIFVPAEEHKRTRQHWLEAVAATAILACIPLVTLLVRG
jgi:polysaccharide chain length determinant protein (PEP-CTERM system associated)